MAREDTSAKPLMAITGASRGIGRAILERALDAGYRIAAVDVDPVGLAALADEIAHPDLHTAVVDITAPDQVDAWLVDLVANVGVPDALVNNAGIVRLTRLEDVRLEDWRAMLDVNLTGSFIVTQLVGRQMIANGGGSMVSIGSVASMAWTVGGSSYPCSKAGIAMLMNGVALEWGRFGIRANTVSPGYTETDMTAPIFANPVSGPPRIARVPLGRTAQPSEIADLAVFLCSPQAGYITGQNIAVDGGITISPLLAPPPTVVEEAGRAN